MNPGADRLPIDVLEKIFSYLPCEELVKVQFVCTWWQQASWEKGLWKNIMYKPDARNNVIKMLNVTPQLRTLSLKFSSVDNDLIQFITDSCPNLEHLHISWDSIYNNSDVTITRPMNQIKILSFFWSGNSSLDFPYLDSAFPNLESLNIIQLRFKRKDLEYYLEKKQDSLHTLSISCCTDDGLCILPCLSVCTKLKNLSLYRMCDKVLWKEVQHLANISHLAFLSFEVNNVDNSSEVFCFFPNITTLVLDGCDGHVAENVHTVACNCPQLQKLEFSNYCSCYEIITMLLEEQLMVDILQDAIHMERLAHLYIYKNTSVTDKSIKHLRLMSHLIHLDLYDCKSVTTGCLKLICGFSKLEVLKFDLRNQPLPADLRASDVKNKALQLRFYNCRDVSSLESLRQQHLRVGPTGYSSCEICCSYPCHKVYCTCWTERYNCRLHSLLNVARMLINEQFNLIH